MSLILFITCVAASFINHMITHDLTCNRLPLFGDEESATSKNPVHPVTWSVTREITCHWNTEILEIVSLFQAGCRVEDPWVVFSFPRPRSQGAYRLEIISAALIISNRYWSIRGYKRRAYNLQSISTLRPKGLGDETTRVGPVKKKLSPRKFLSYIG